MPNVNVPVAFPATVPTAHVWRALASARRVVMGFCPVTETHPELLVRVEGRRARFLVLQRVSGGTTVHEFEGTVPNTRAHREAFANAWAARLRPAR